ncbi:hypothetical protein GCM10023194_80960 [Planotetraspora phitsanulokensis]|uniref:Lipoprotein n=1 Tax=Planotetraspora phitsanulokensis TaxID=575192 RepID=A0A8J3XJ53_9ACTN|nr:hypothetical protein [Planotetraspora phitsanulokensis]GII42830.1 hypothetical protein Pph01_78330 [Planotetraspora phitsanulokensis]
MRKRSRALVLGAIPALSAMVMSACSVVDEGQEVTADCVDTSSRADDGSYRRVDDRYCEGGSHRGYTYVYGGNLYGGRVRRGTTIQPKDTAITSRGGRVIVRGGFGGRIGGGS